MKVNCYVVAGYDFPIEQAVAEIKQEITQLRVWWMLTKPESESCRQYRKKVDDLQLKIVWLQSNPLSKRNKQLSCLEIQCN